jgi:hypothetical protein
MAIARRLIALALAGVFLGNTGCFWEGREHGEHARYYRGDDDDRYERQHRFHHHDDEHEHEDEGRGMGHD